MQRRVRKLLQNGASPSRLQAAPALLGILSCALGCATRPLPPSPNEAIRNDYYQLSDTDPVTRAAILAVQHAEKSTELQDDSVRICVYQTTKHYMVELIPNYQDSVSTSASTTPLQDHRRPDRLPGELVELGSHQAFVLSKSTLRTTRVISQGELEHTPRLFYGTNGDIRFCSLFGPLEDAGVILPPRR